MQHINVSRVYYFVAANQWHYSQGGEHIDEDQL